ncbi:MAG: esterase family protein [Corynebacterium humireducens]|jgi:S-formylglutathione hydrolase FrmB|uniref:Esterase family protein n=1 Tax=Corynebacterium humireducens TaxID=1223514 RepID=A0A7X6SXI8_9CORY|nr:esterase family protein [Corynebacterium humireducens]
MRPTIPTLAATLLLLLPAPAVADSPLRDSLADSSRDVDATGALVEGTVDSLHRIGSSELPLPAVSPDPRFPLPLSDAIVRPGVLHREVIDADARLERWSIASPAMKRPVDVQIIRAPGPAPLLLLLDGIDSPSESDWITRGHAPEVFRDEDVTVVMPTDATASLYSDWVSDDPVLGRQQWETFLTAELLPLLDAHPDLHSTGRHGVGGLSMGAAGALHLAANHPDLFDGVFGISGCYSPLSPIGRQTTNLIVASRGGTLDNLWGEFGSPQWQRHDTAAHPEGLRDRAVYLTAATGALEGAELQEFLESEELTSMGTMLERGALTCTRDLDLAMRAHGMTHQQVVYRDTGAHNWIHFHNELRPAWEAIRDALQ